MTHYESSLYYTFLNAETGGIAITPPSQCEVKPGFIMKPFLGVEPVLMDENVSDNTAT